MEQSEKLLLGGMLVFRNTIKSSGQLSMELMQSKSVTCPATESSLQVPASEETMFPLTQMMKQLSRVWPTANIPWNRSIMPLISSAVMN